MTKRRSAHQLPRQFLATLVFALALVGGCRNSGRVSEADNAAAAEPIGDAQRGASILAECIAQYRRAAHYRDEARLVLRYRLDGRLMEEPHCWSVSFDRGARVAAEVFQARLRADPRGWMTYVYDFRSNNLDQQVLCGENSNGSESLLPLAAICDDPVAFHFLSGQEELPLAEDHGEELLRSLVPPTLWWLCGEATPWFDPAHARCLGRSVIDGRECWHLLLAYSGFEFNLWIDPETHRLARIQFPVRMFHPRVREGRAIVDVALTAEFLGASFAPAEPPAARWKPPEGAVPVSRFVPIPEPFPTPLVGESCGDAPLGPDGSERKTLASLIPASPRAAGGAMVWLDLETIPPEVEGLRRLNHAIELVPGGAAGLAAVIVATPPGAPLPHADVECLQRALAQVCPGTLVVDDPGGRGAAALQISNFPIITVVDARHRLQWAKALPTTHITAEQAEETAQVLMRLTRGDDVAGEMRADYERFLTTYKEKLAGAAADSAWQNILGRAQAILPACSVEPAWKVSSLARPGNMVAIPRPAGIWVLDGFQTVVEIGGAGDVMRTMRLPIGTAAVNRLLTAIGRDGTRWFAAYSAFGRDLFVFDGEWNLVASYAGDKALCERILDACLADVDGDGQPEIWISGGESRVIQASCGAERAMASLNATGVSAIRELESASADQLLLLRGMQPPLRVAQDMQPVEAAVAVPGTAMVIDVELRRRGDGPWAAIARSPSGNAAATFLTAAGNMHYRLAVELPEEPANRSSIGRLVGDSDSAHAIWGVLDARAGLRVVAWDRGTALVPVTQPCTGFALLEDPEFGTLAIVGTADQIAAWRVDWNAGPD